MNDPWRALAVLLALIALVAQCQAPPPGGGGGGGGPTTTTIPVDGADELLTFPMIEGLTAPTNVEIAPDGRVFVAEKSGIVRTYDSITDTTPTVAVDMSGPVRSVGEHGLLGMVLDADYPTRPYMYVLHTWDSTGLWGDGCRSNYGINGCVTGGRIARLTLGPDGVVTAGPDTIVDDRWCMQFSSHGVGDLDVLPDGSLLASAGDGAYFVGADYGQKGGQQFFPPVDDLTPRNACGDPPVPVGAAQDPVTSQGGALRAQDVLTMDDPLGWNGAVVRLDPDTGAAVPDNPLVGVGSADDDHLIAHGLRNPYRIAALPGGDRVAAIDVGQARFEEINMIDLDAPEAANFGWPCREGPIESPLYGPLGNEMCALAQSDQARTALTEPWFAYPRGGKGGAISAIEVVPAGRYDDDIVGDLVFSDYVEGITWTLGIAPDGSADPAGPNPVSNDGIVVDLEAGPDGYLYALDYAAGTVSRLVDRDSAPVARLVADPTEGPLPLTVALDASGSEQPGGGALTFAWDLDDDGEFDDDTGPTSSVTLTSPADLTVRVRVTNSEGASTVADATIYGGNTAPQVTVDVTSALPWAAYSDIAFSITATDAEDGPLPASAVSWAMDLRHCYAPDDCHSHPYAEATGETAGVVSGPSHGYPSYLQLVVRATDSRGQTTTVTRDLQPATVEITVTSDPPGATVTIGDSQEVTPFVHTAIRDDQIAVSTAEQQTIGGVPHTFSSWSTGAARSHQYTAAGDAALHLTMSPTP